MKNIFLLSMLIGGCIISAGAQEVVAPAGSFHQGNNYSISWTLGEVVTSTLYGDNHTLTQGFHQSELTVTSITPDLFPEMIIKAYPNPVNDLLMVTLDGELKAGAVLNFYDISGRLMLQQTIDGHQAEVSLNSLNAGIYFLKIVTENQEIKTFKIVKK